MGSILLVLLFGTGSAVRADDTLALGFGAFEPGLNIPDAREPLATVLRAAVGEGLLSVRRRSDGAPPKGGFELALADSLHVSADLNRWSFRVRGGALFQSGRPVSAQDVLFSLEMCRRRGELTWLKKYVSRRVQTPYDTLEDWVDLEVESGKEVAAVLPLDLARCPVWEASSAEIFGAEFGRGANFVASGPYRVVGFRPGKQYSLARVGRPEQVDTAGVARVDLRSFSESARGLTALREGTIAVLFTEDRAVNEKAKADETLVPFLCGGASAIRRRDVIFSCEPTIDMAHLRVGR